MFNWLRNLLGDDDRFDLYTPRQRRIYRYYDGSKTVAADPMVLYKRMASYGSKLDTCLQVATSKLWGKEADKVKAHEDAVTIVRDIFSLGPLTNKGGLTEAECFDLLNHWFSYLGWLKKNTSPPPTSLPDPGVGTLPSAGPPPTPNSSDNGSAAAVPSTEPPAPSPSESASPSDSSTLPPNTTPP